MTRWVLLVWYLQAQRQFIISVSMSCDGMLRGGSDSRWFTEPESTGYVRLLEGQALALQ